jgi:hypothetical protein
MFSYLYHQAITGLSAAKKFLFKTAPDWIHERMSSYYNSTVNFFMRWWKKTKPKIDKTSQAATAIYTASSTFQLTIGILPIVLSVVTVLATVPLIHFILPSFLLEPYILYPTMLAISVYAGYSQYCESITRDKLDRQIIKDHTKIRELNHKVQMLEQRLAHIEQPENKKVISDIDAANHKFSPYGLRAKKPKTQHLEITSKQRPRKSANRTV